MNAAPPQVHAGAAVDGEPAPIRFRATARQIVPLVIAFVFISLSGAVQVVVVWRIAPGSGVTAWWSATPLVLMVVMAAETWLLGRWVGITLTADAAVVHNLRRRTIAWDRIAAVTVEPFMSAHTVVLYETDGRRTRLRAPSTGFMAADPRFAEKVAVIHGWWMARRGPTPPGAPAPLRVPPHEAALPERLRLRASVTQRLLPVAALTWWACDLAVSSGLPDGADAVSRTVGLVIAVAVLAVAGYLYWRGRVDLDVSALRVHGWRRRTIRWADIDTITVEARRGGRRVVVHEADGRCTTLPAPRVGPLLWDNGFQAKADLLDRWWREHRPDRPEPAAVTPLPPYVGPRGWQQVVVGLIWLAIGYEIVVSIFVGLLFAAL